MDVDGTLTDGKIYIGASGEVIKAFDIKDGYGIKNMLALNRIRPIVLTGRSSDILTYRCGELGITDVYQGVENKSESLLQIIESLNGFLNECAYIGDDLNDIMCMKLIKEAGGIVGCPADACFEVANLSSYVCVKNGGQGAVREFIELIIGKNSLCD